MKYSTLVFNVYIGREEFDPSLIRRDNDPGEFDVIKVNTLLRKFLEHQRKDGIVPDEIYIVTLDDWYVRFAFTNYDMIPIFMD